MPKRAARKPDYKKAAVAHFTRADRMLERLYELAERLLAGEVTP